MPNVDGPKRGANLPQLPAALARHPEGPRAHGPRVGVDVICRWIEQDLVAAGRRAPR